MLFLKSKILSLKAIHNYTAKSKEEKLLFLKSKILSLKAIHNLYNFVVAAKMVVSEVKDTKFESNSQLFSWAKEKMYGCF